MKKLICIILVALCAFCVFARDKHVTTSETGRQVEDLLDDGLYNNKETIISLVPLLTPEEITLLYNKNEESSVADALENGLLGMGMGSFFAGDKKGGWIQLGCELGGAVVGITSLGYFVAYGFAGIMTAVFGQQDETISGVIGASVVGIFAGAGAFIGGRIYGIVRGIKYPKQYNKDLKEVLYGPEEELQITFAPVFAPNGMGFGVGVRF